MKPLLIAGNWKSNKTVSEAKEWVTQFENRLESVKVSLADKEIVLFVPFTMLAVLKWDIGQKNLPVKIGAQDISPFPVGAYTGEVSGSQIKELADWVIIGHSERRKFFGENDELLKKKVDQARDSGLKVIYCVQDEKTTVPAGVEVVAYEPVWAIGTGKSDNPDNAAGVISAIKAKSQVKTVIYGGSVTAENVRSFTGQPVIDGVLPGGTSLDPVKFWNLIAGA